LKLGCCIDVLDQGVDYIIGKYRAESNAISKQKNY